MSFLPAEVVTVTLPLAMPGLIAGMVLMWLLLQFRQSALYSILATAAVIVISFAVAYTKVRGYK